MWHLSFDFASTKDSFAILLRNKTKQNKTNRTKPNQNKTKTKGIKQNIQPYKIIGRVHKN